MILPGDEEHEGENAGADGDEAFEAHERLTLADEDDALPWLESDEGYVEEGSDYRILIFAVLALAALAAILYGGYHFLNGRGSNQEVADGSTIEAPASDYKSRPENPGGSEVAGTGDISYEVGEGQTREGQLADDAPRPSIDRTQGEAPVASAPGTPAASTSSAASVSGGSSGVGVQVGAYSSRAAAESGWSQLAGRYAALSGVSHRIIEGSADSGTIYRLQAVAGDAGSADTMCRAIKAVGGDCQVKR